MSPVLVATAEVFVGEQLGRWSEPGGRAFSAQWVPLRRAEQAVSLDVGDIGALPPSPQASPPARVALTSLVLGPALSRRLVSRSLSHHLRFSGRIAGHSEKVLESGLMNMQSGFMNVFGGDHHQARAVCFRSAAVLCRSSRACRDCAGLLC